MSIDLFLYICLTVKLLCSNLSIPFHKKPGLYKNINHVQAAIRSYQRILLDQYTETLEWTKLLYGVKHQA